MTPQFWMRSRRAFAAGLFVVVLAGAGCPRDAAESPLDDPSGRHWLRFVHFSDTQIVDEESPARVVRFAPLTRSAWRPQEAYGVQTLDATLRVINDRVGAKGDETFPIDFAIITGDVTDGSQWNELRWFIDTMDGAAVVPDSGELDGALREQAPEDNPKLAYETAGLDPSIPWYTVFGNHDGLAVGTFAIDRTSDEPLDWRAPMLPPVSTLLGLHLTNPPSDALEPVNDRSPAAIMGSVDVADPDTLELRFDLVTPGPIVADARRQFSSREQFILEHFNTTTNPAGHGFTESNLKSGKTRYSFRPVDEVPVRVIVLDTVAPNPVDGIPAHYGVMTVEQFQNFVVPELELARAAGEFVILASHHPSADFDIPYTGLTVGTSRFREYLASQPHVIAHICGHTHRNYVQRIDGENSYYEIETGSIIDYPQEARILDIYFDEDSDTIRIAGEMFSHMENPTRLSAESFRRAEAHAELDNADTKALAELLAREGITSWPKALPPKEERYGRPGDRVFDVTLKRERGARSEGN